LRRHEEDTMDLFRSTGLLADESDPGESQTREFAPRYGSRALLRALAWRTPAASEPCCRADDACCPA
jgi:hypothetical protein